MTESQIESRTALASQTLQVCKIYFLLFIGLPTNLTRTIIKAWQTGSWFSVNNAWACDSSHSTYGLCRLLACSIWIKPTELQQCLNCGHGFLVRLGIGKSTDFKVGLMEEVVMRHWSEVAKIRSKIINYLEWDSTAWHKVTRSPYSSINCISEDTSDLGHAPYLIHIKFSQVWKDRFQGRNS